LYLDCLQNNLKICNNINRIQDFANIEKYNFKYFYNYNKTSLLSYILRLKINIFVIILRNLESFLKYNNICICLIHINQNVLEAKIIDSKCYSIKILIFCISLKSKNNKISQDYRLQVFYLFIKRQFSIRSTFAIIINKFQNQSFRYIDINIQIRNCFNYNQFYVVASRITKKKNLYIIVLVDNIYSKIDKICNVQ